MTINATIENIIATTKDELTTKTGEELGIKSHIKCENSVVHLNLRTGFPCEFLKKRWVPKLHESLQSSLPNYQIDITLEAFIQAHKTQMVGKGLRGIKNTIAIASGKGGVGKSTVTINLASTLQQQGARVGILDADIYGPSIPTMLGKTTPVETKDEHYLPVIAHGIQAMSIGYLTHEESPLIWRGPMLAKALIQMLDLTYWDNLDYLLIDLPPGTGDIQLSLIQKIPLTSAIIVTTPQTVATKDAQKAFEMFKNTNINVLGIIENMSLHTCKACGHQEALFGQGGAKAMCDRYNTKLLGQLPLDAQITEYCDKGVPITASESSDLGNVFMKTGLNVGIELAQRPLNYGDKFPPIVTE